MQTLIKPKNFIPVHGEYRHLKQHGELAIKLGLNPKNVVIPEVGNVIEVNRSGIRKVELSFQVKYLLMDLELEMLEI